MTALLIDTDPGADDALAILMALRSSEVEVAALTTVAGNLAIEHTTRNALAVLDAAGASDVPVHAGAGAGLLGPPAGASHIHGEDGLGDAGLSSRRTPDPTPALEATLRLLRERGPEIVWVALGPLTNVAMAVLVDARACRSVRRLVVMGGVADGIGNATPAAEFNLWADPEAARIVLRAGLPIRMVGWDVARRDALLTGADRDLLAASTDPAGRFAAAATGRLFEFTSQREPLGTMDLPDPATMATILDPDVASWRECHVDVECSGALTRGALVIDHWGTTGQRANVALCTRVDADRFRALTLDLLTGGATRS